MQCAFLVHKKLKHISDIFSLVAKSYMQNKFCVIFFERKIQGSALAGSYISLEEVILNKSTTRHKANITAQQYHSSLDEYHKSVRIYLVVAIPYGKSDKAFLFISLYYIQQHLFVRCYNFQHPPLCAHIACQPFALPFRNLDLRLRGKQLSFQALLLQIENL